MEGLIFGGAYIQRALYTYKGKFAFQNRLSLNWEGNMHLKIHWVSLYISIIVGRKFISVICSTFLLKLALRTWIFLKLSLASTLCLVQFYLWFKFYFPLFRTHHQHYHTQKQRKIKFKPEIKLNHNIYMD